MTPSLSRRALAVLEPIWAEPQRAGVRRLELRSGARLLDCGVVASGSAEAGLALAEACLAGLAELALGASPIGGRPTAVLSMSAADPWLPCLASQYAGWKVAADGFEAMGSGPARAVGSPEPLLARLGYREPPQPTVLLLESDRLPGDAVAAWVASQCGIAPRDLTLLVAPTGSRAGTLQIAARSVETALHKLEHLGFDAKRVRHGRGRCPVAPPTADFVDAFGRTNDAILYGCEVELTVDATDAELAALTRRVPSSASPDYGVPCAELIRRTGGDFYKIDPGLFSPARIALVGRSGARHEAGRLDLDLVARSFYGTDAA
jgi:methenyltetrahydromethanopterin cyclohydrolase